MARRYTVIGTNTREILEDIPAGLAARFLDKVIQGVQGDDATSAFSDATDAAPDARLALGQVSSLDPEILSEIEAQSLRVTEMGDVMGAQSLKTVVPEAVSDEEWQKFDEQPDDISKSCWAFIELPFTFQNAESFHHARKDRERGRIHSAFGLDLNESIPASAASVDVPALTDKLNRVLGLGKAPKLSAIDLPETEKYPSSVMVIVRHGADLSSVYEHRDDGSRRPYYFRPQDEIILIYTARDQLIEVLGRSFGQRHDVSNAFAEVVLGHNISEKPLTEKVYDLGRFVTSFELEIPDIEGVEVQSAVVTECELLLGSYGRRASLKVTRQDDIDLTLNKYLAGAARFRGATGIHRVVISVEYRREDVRRTRSMNITVRGTNGSNVQSHKDRATRELGARLLEAWGVTRKLRPLEQEEIADMLPSLMRLFDLGETVLTGLRLAELGLSVDTLLDARLVSQKKRQSLTLVEDDNDNVVETETFSVTTSSGYSARDYTEFNVAWGWLCETLVNSLASNLATKTFHQISEDLVRVGDLATVDGSAPVYLARGLFEAKTIFSVEEELRSRETAGAGVVVCAGSEAPRFIANNVAVPVDEIWNADAESPGLSIEKLLDRLTSERRLIAQTTMAQVVRSGNHSGSFLMPRKAPLPLSSAIQLAFFEKLARAYNAGAPEVHSSVLIEGTSSRTPREIFTGKMRERIFDAYVEKGIDRGMWRLKE
ncbi:hypothetical protein [Roseivivax sediminis]|uniref:Uncharacterized protein n=1 Tax=Roseivivax sediminis TaxID=936889 RepID=A0A1I1S9E5_9RHOB|nr:hypothetical protein [Roseivivax sediminis]SFD42972.1 hypothetical protein SAMN04515678_10139 [Roseivivax sediminis]